MTGSFCATWRIDPATPPRPWRHCPGCGCSQPFRSSGKVRLNANGRKLDAWLIYKCEACDRTWNRPLVERAPVTAIAERDLHAMQASDPAWVRVREFDLAALRQHCERVEGASGAVVTKLTRGALPDGWAVIELTIEAVGPVGERLDRVLARELGVSRAAVQAMQAAGGLVADGVLSRPVRGRAVVRFVSGRLTDGQRAAVAAGIAAG